MVPGFEVRERPLVVVPALLRRLHEPLHVHAREPLVDEIEDARTLRSGFLEGGGEPASGGDGGSIALTTGPVTLSNVMDRAPPSRPWLRQACEGRVAKLHCRI